MVKLLPAVRPSLNDRHLGDWIHHPSRRMQQSPRLSAFALAHLPRHHACPAFVAASLPRHSICAAQHPPNIVHPERSEVPCAIARLVRDESAFLFRSVTSALAASQSPVDTTRVLPYSAPANDFANPSPPSSSRHRAALDEVCIADSLTQDSHHPLAQRPSGFFVFRAQVAQTLLSVHHFNIGTM